MQSYVASLDSNCRLFWMYVLRFWQRLERMMGLLVGLIRTVEKPLTLFWPLVRIWGLYFLKTACKVIFSFVTFFEMLKFFSFNFEMLKIFRLCMGSGFGSWITLHLNVQEIVLLFIWIGYFPFINEDSLKFYHWSLL